MKKFMPDKIYNILVKKLTSPQTMQIAVNPS